MIFWGKVSLFIMLWNSPLGAHIITSWHQVLPGIICNSLSFWHAVYLALLIQSKLCTGHNQDIVSMDSSLSQSQSYRRRQDQRQLCSLVDILENRGEIHGTHVTVLDLSSRLSPPHSSLPPHSEQANTSHAAFTHLWHLSYISIHSTNGDMR